MATKIYMLVKRDDLGSGNPWSQLYLTSCCFMARAETEAEARAMADAAAGAEKNYEPDAWLSSDYSSCFEITPEGTPGLIGDPFVPLARWCMTCGEWSIQLVDECSNELDDGEICGTKLQNYVCQDKSLLDDM